MKPAMFPDWSDKTAIIVGTGPSLTTDQTMIIHWYKTVFPEHLAVFGINNTFQVEHLPIDVFFACNPEWWDYYGEDKQLLERQPHTDMWTWDRATADRHTINHIPAKWSGGKRNVTSLSEDQNYIHYGHGSGYEVLGLAYHYGCRHFILAGYDLRFAGGYDPAARTPGSGRHFFGEYPKPLQHWPGASGRNVDHKTGDLTGLLDLYHTIDLEHLNLRITNCSPGSALDFFGTGELESEIIKCIPTTTS